MPAKMPQQFIASPERTVADLREGEFGRVPSRALKLKSDGTVWIYRQATLLKDGEVGEKDAFVTLSRESTGLHADMRRVRPDHQYSVDTLMNVSPESYIPIETITTE